MELANDLVWLAKGHDCAEPVLVKIGDAVPRHKQHIFLLDENLHVAMVVLLKEIDGMDEQSSLLQSNARFSEEEQKRCRELFAPVGEKYRSRTHFGMIVLGIGFAFILMGMLFPRIYIEWFIGAFFICWLILVTVAITQASLECPACRGNLVSSEFGGYCPECGAAHLKPGSWLRSAHFDSCGKTLRRGKSRQYRIRACTHCGIVLDDRGI